ncbi:hypothetical protein EYF80_055687 [Liparis tanakae]|uniref:Uncharacterized protein n=1 Tax=Liparis tanakae TaxID=230148 RepID=A0A4Z2EZF1_9TELE|nr:hypothetical protein EYF80_055687 [Liparis tanakae]
MFLWRFLREQQLLSVAMDTTERALERLLLFITVHRADQWVSRTDTNGGDQKQGGVDEILWTLKTGPVVLVVLVVSVSEEDLRDEPGGRTPSPSIRSSLLH